MENLSYINQTLQFSSDHFYWRLFLLSTWALVERHDYEDYQYIGQQQGYWNPL